MDENKKSININSDLIILLCLGVVVLLFMICSRMSMNIFGSDAGECLSIAFFGKLELRNVDRIVMQTEEKEIVITDPELIEELVSQTAVATHTALCCHAEVSIDLYRGDKCIRSMKWGPSNNIIKVYDADISHWILTAEGIEKEGLAYLSDDLESRLIALID